MKQHLQDLQLQRIVTGFNADESPQQLQRAQHFAAGPRGGDGLTTRERRLLAALRIAGFEVSTQGALARFIQKRKGDDLTAVLDIFSKRATSK